jgi:hypothetical protein
MCCSIWPAVPEPAVPEPAVPEPAVPEPAVPEPAVPEKEGTVMTDDQQDTNPFPERDFQHDLAHEQTPETDGEPEPASPPVRGTGGDYEYDMAHEVE